MSKEKNNFVVFFSQEFIYFEKDWQVEAGAKHFQVPEQKTLFTFAVLRFHVSAFELSGLCLVSSDFCSYDHV